MRLSQQLFLRILPTVMITIAIIGVFAYRSGTREIDNIYDAQLINDANVLWSILQRPLSRPQQTLPIRVPDLDFNMDNQLAINSDADDFADAHMFRAWRGDKLAVFSTNSFPATVQRFKDGFTDFQFEGDLWRVYALTIPRTDVTMEVAENTSIRQGLVVNILLDVAFPLLVLVPAIAFLIWLGITNGLSSVNGLVAQIRSRSPDDLERISGTGLPKDLAPLVASLNQLLSKLARSLTMERHFSDLAAHQLRTPQAGIKLLIQLLARADTPEERQLLMNDLATSNERAMRMIEQLLRLARVSHQPVSVTPINLHDFAAEAISDFSNTLELRGFKTELVGDAAAVVDTDKALLRLMFDNLLDNAIKYSPGNGEIRVDIQKRSGNFVLSISDTGPGVPADQREAVFQRFNRLSDGNAEGAGLGLPIVADIANRLGATITLGVPDWGHGLKAEISIPPSPRFG